MSAEQNISPQDYELLSAYLDGALTDDARTQLEQRLTSDPFLQHELNSLRATVSLIGQLQPMKAPRDFTLTEAMVTPSNVVRLPVRKRTPYLSLVASVMLMIFGALFLLSESSTAELLTSGASIVQSESQADKALPTDTLSDPADALEREDLQGEPVVEESAEETFSLDEAPTEADGIMQMQAPAANEALSDSDDAPQSLAIQVTEANSEGRTEVEDTTLAGGLANTAESDMSDDSAGEGFADSTLLYDAVIDEEVSEPEVPPVMAGADLGASQTTADGFNASSSAPADGDDTSEIAVQDADTNDEVQQNRMLATPTDSPPPEPAVIERPASTTDNIAVGVGLLGAGILLMLASLIFIRRNRS